MISTPDLVKTPQTARSADDILRSRVGVLLGVTPAIETALATIDIKTVFDLAASRVFAAASRLLDNERNPSSVDVRLDAVPADAVTRPADVPVAALARQPIAILTRIGPARAQAIAAALDTPAVRDLALWPPYRNAKEILAAAFFPEQQTGFDPDAPADLLPLAGAQPTERVFYKRLLIDAAPPTLQGTIAIEQSDPIDVLPGILNPSGFQKLATGALLTFSQSWFAQGLTLGQLLHSTSLAPGESTRLALVDWVRRTSASASESVSEAEQLSNSSVHSRALNEVTSATATEVQTGNSFTTSKSSTGQSGGGFGFEVGPLAFGGSSSSAKTTTEAMSATSSFGSRDLAAQFAQNINDRSQQNASSVRNRRATTVREVSQEEHETISTRAIANYNHMHALSIQYYEVVQAFRVTTQLDRAERCLFVPLKLVNFHDPAVVERSRLVLARAALTPDVANALAEFGTVKVTSKIPLLFTAQLQAAVVKTAAAAAASTEADTTPTPAAAAIDTAKAAIAYQQPSSRIAGLAAAGWNLSQLARLGRAGGRLLLASRTNAVYVPDDALVIGFSLREGQGKQFVVRRTDGTVVAQSGTTTATVDFTGAIPIADLDSISIQNAETASRTTALVLHMSLFGTLTTLDVPIHLSGGGASAPLEECVSFDGGQSTRDLVDHLEANKLHYSQAIFRALDGPSIAALLARFSFRGVPLAQLVDQQPVAVSSNFLVFKMGMPAAGDADDPRLADDLKAWRTFLTRTGLDRPVPKSDIVPLPSGGVFAEAVLGRFNAAERLDLQRFWNWQDSPIPISAPEIAAIEAGSRARDENVTPGQLSSPVVNIQAPTALPDPTGVGAALTALQNANLFRDMSGLAQTAALAQASQQVSAAGATAAEAQAGQNLETVMSQNTQRMRIAAQLAAQMAGLPASGSTGGTTPPGKNSVTERGGELNQAAELDAKKSAGGTTTAQESAFKNQQGTQTRDLANQLVTGTLTGGDTSAQPPSAPVRGIGPKQPLPRTLNAVLQVTNVFADTTLFGSTPVHIDAFIREPGGKHIWERSGAAAPRFSGTLTTAETRLDFQLGYTYTITWAGPVAADITKLQSIGLNVAPNATQLDIVVTAMVDTRTFTVQGPPPADKAALKAALIAQGIDLVTVPAEPVVTPKAGSFDVTVRVLRTVAVYQQ